MTQNLELPTNQERIRQAAALLREVRTSDDALAQSVEAVALQCDDLRDYIINGREPTTAQLEAMNNPDSGPSERHYRDSMRDAGRGGLLG